MPGFVNYPNRSSQLVLRALNCLKHRKVKQALYISTSRRWRCVSDFYILTFVFCGTGFIAAQDSGKNRVLKLEELSQTEIDKFDRNKSVFILTFGNLEEHGPHDDSRNSSAKAWRSSAVFFGIRSQPTSGQPAQHLGTGQLLNPARSERPVQEV